MNSYKSPGVDHILAEPLQTGGNILRSEIHSLLILFGVRVNCHSSERIRLFYLFEKG
jgi:hypothetical protein